MVDLTQGEIVIISGEGTGPGTIEVYNGPRTARAINARLRAERCSGDRWASAWIKGTQGDARWYKLAPDCASVLDERDIVGPIVRRRMTRAEVLSRRSEARKSFDGSERLFRACWRQYLGCLDGSIDNPCSLSDIEDGLEAIALDKVNDPDSVFYIYG